jgi:steroid delta-isomerase-like uncharacterized protein
MSRSERNVELARRWFEDVWNDKRREAIAELMAPGGISHDLGQPGLVLEGPAAFAKVFDAFIGAFPDLRVTVEDVLSDGDKVAVRWRAIGTHRGDHLGAPASGECREIAGITILVVRDGRITEGWDCSEMAPLFTGGRTAPPWT